ncbi:MAG: DUF1800 family protein [Bdellovibrionales bacterium]|nr:DUF1800 family protein [Bdellovibrionales bacterium]
MFRASVLGPLYLFIAIACLSMLISSPAWAAAKKNKGPKVPVVESGDYQLTTLNLKRGKKGSQTKPVEIACFGGTGGFVKAKGGKEYFYSFSDLFRDSKKKFRLAKQKRQNALADKWDFKAKRFAKLRKGSPSACSAISDTPSEGDNPNDDGSTQVSFKPYTGTFGPEQARILFDRFCFGGSQAEIDRAVQEGLTATVNRLTTYIAEPAIDAAMEDIACDRFLQSEGSESEEVCNSKDPTDFRMDGFRQAMYYRMVHSENCYFNKLLTFLHDERLAVSTVGLPREKYHLAKEHFKILDKAAQSGDYIQYIRNSNNDGLVAYFNLDLGNNNKFAPNENYAREFWEILTIGPADEDTVPLYSVLDIAQSALAFTGGGWQRIEIELGGEEQARIDNPSYSLLSHADGQKTIFLGTPYAATVDNAEDVLQATLNHPYLARNLARELLQEFLVPHPSRDSIGELARILRENKYNLHAAMKTMMLSEDLYAPANQKTLLKHAWDFLFGFLRSTHYPINHREMDSYFDEIGEQLFISPSIFGWDTDSLNAERYVLERRNVVIHMMRLSSDDLAERNYSLYDELASNLPNSAAQDDALLSRIVNLLGVRINTTQRALLNDYLNYDYNACDRDEEVAEFGCRKCSYSVASSDPTYCDEAIEHYQLRNGIDIHPDGGFETKLQGLIAMLLTSPEYLSK